MNNIKAICLLSGFVVGLVFLTSASGAAERFTLKEFDPLVRVVDLNLGEESVVELCNGTQVRVKLISLKEHRDPVRLAVRWSELSLKIDGKRVSLEAGAYRLPVKVGGVQVDCTVTKGLNSNGTPEFWGLDKAARFRFWPAASPLIRTGSLIYPLRQSWQATRTWFDNEVVDGGDRIKKTIYYHAGLDIGAAEGLDEVIAASDALVVQRGLEVLKGHERDTPTRPRADVVYLLDGRGWYYRYSHLKEIAAHVQLGETIRQGELIGIAGKEGASGGWSHLHFEIKSRQPSGKWGTEAGYAFLRAAYLHEFGLKLYANARPQIFLVAGGEAKLDGTRSWSATGKITTYEWTLHDGSRATGAVVPLAYSKPGQYSEVLKITDAKGNVAYDFANVMVLDPDDLNHYPPNVNANFYPSRDIRPGQWITFQARSFRMRGGKEVWKFGDGTPVRFTNSPTSSDAHDPRGYARIKHSYKKPGTYIVTVSRTHQNGQTATTSLCVQVTEQ